MTAATITVVVPAVPTVSVSAGVQGPPGTDGIIGVDGAQGPQGEVGPQGIQGVQGIQGADGADGADGAIGPQGIQGIQGAVGPTGPEGPTAVSTDAGQLATLGTDSLILVAIAPADIGAATMSADLADFTSGAATLGQVPAADGTGGVGWATPTGGEGEIHLVRADTVANLSYLGTAPTGSLEGAAVWDITRITLNADGTVVTATALDVAWSDHLTATYT